MIVADTNLILALAINSDKAEVARAVFKKDSEWHAPPIWESEFRNAALKLIQANQMNQATAVAAFAFARGTVQTVEVSTPAVLRIAQAYHLTAYDAEFVALAEWLDCRAVSFDQDLLGTGLVTRPQDF